MENVLECSNIHSLVMEGFVKLVEHSHRSWKVWKMYGISKIIFQVLEMYGILENSLESFGK